MRLKILFAGIISGVCLVTCSVFPLTGNADKAIGDEYPLNGLNHEDSPVKPTLSLSRIEFPIDVAYANPIQDIELAVNGAAGKWGPSGIHIDFDERLTLVKSDQLSLYSQLQGADSECVIPIGKMKDIIASNIDEAMDSRKWMYSSVENGKNGIEHGYIKITEPEDPDYPVTKGTGNLVYTINGITPFDENVKMIVNGCVDNTSKEMIVPDEIEGMKIDYLSFKNCENVEKIQVPEYLTSFHMNGLAETAWYKNSSDGILYLGNTAVIYKGDTSTITSLIVKEGTKRIADYAFYAAAPYAILGIATRYIPNNLNDITLPDSLEYIGCRSFIDCDSLEHIDFPKNLKKIDSQAFSYCDVLDNVVIPQNVESVGSAAFFCCGNLKSITFLNPNCEIEDEWGVGATITNDYVSEDEIAYKGTIYGYMGSTAQAYAEKYGYNFKALDEESETTTTETTPSQPEDYDLGDVNEDGKGDARDASMVLVAYAKVSTGSEDSLTEKQRKAADVNSDGKVDAKDASSILAYYALVSTASSDIPTMKEFMAPKKA